MTHDGLVNTLQIIRPNTQWNLRGNTYQSIEWLDLHSPIPTEKEILDNYTEQPLIQNKWEKLVTLEDKMNFLAKNMGLTS